MQRLLYIVVHFLFWTTFLTLSWMAISAVPEEKAFILDHPMAILLLILWAMINFYTFYFYVQPRWLDTRKFVTYLFISLGFSLLSSVVFISFFWVFFESFRPYAIQKLAEGLVGTFLISQCGSLLRGFISWNNGLHEKAELENKSLKNELSLLKAQLSPHFLFNTLNNIDTLIYKSQDEASAMLIKLSTLLRYMLYDSDTSEVPITNEIDYLRQLTDLQKLRFQEPSFISFHVDNENPNLKVAPLLLLPFVENAFKFVSDPEDLPAIIISITVKDQRLAFHCENYFDPESNGSDHGKGGIGLMNVQRRLELLYPGKFKLNLTHRNHKFFVDLRLSL